MKSLSNWIKNITTDPVRFSNKKYLHEHIVREELDSYGYLASSSKVSIDLLQDLHKRLFMQPCEEAIWDAILWYLAHPLPRLIANELIDRSVSVVAMGHTRQVDEIQWRLATFSEYALYTLIMERYMDDHYTTLQFKNMLYLYTLYRNKEGILHMLSFYKTPSLEKQEILDIFMIVDNK